MVKLANTLQNEQSSISSEERTAMDKELNPTMTNLSKGMEQLHTAENEALANAGYVGSIYDRSNEQLSSPSLDLTRDQGYIAGVHLNYERWPEIGVPPISGGDRKSSQDTKMVSVKEAASILGVSDRTIRRIISQPDTDILTELRRETINVPMEVEKLYVSLDDLIQYRNCHGKKNPSQNP